MNLETYVNYLKRKLWITRGARFEAHKYYLTKHELSSYAISFFSAYIIIINFLDLYSILGDAVISSKAIQFSTMTLSVLILAFSQLEAANDYKLKAERFHECSKEISRLLSELDYLSLNTGSHLHSWNSYKKISDEYELIIQKNSDNHHDLHHKSFLASKPDNFKMSDFQRLYIRLRAYLAPRWLYTFLIFTPPVVFIYQLLKSNN